MRRLFSRMRWAWQRLWGARRLDAEMAEEIRFHIEMETERLVRQQGLEAGEARRRAHVRFGGVEKFKEEARDVRRPQWLDALSIDFRLGVRMLVKHRGLTLVGGFAMALAIGLGATFFEVITEMLDPTLPLPMGERVVALQYETSSGNAERRVLHDFAAWREEIRSVELLSAFRTAQQNLVMHGAPPEPVKVAEMTASGFAAAQVPPLMGRHLLAEDEVEGAPAVAVIGHGAWTSRFASDPGIVGRAIDLGGVVRTVVGVMPQGFRFPIDHDFWVPLPAPPAAIRRFEGPEIHVFGRLGRGVAIERARAELTVLGERRGLAHPETGQRMRAVVVPFTHAHVDLTHPGLVLMFRLAQLLVGALTFVVALNLAILFYARTVSRIGEIALRTALGASRGRILAQLFAEALALSLLGAASGLLLAHFTLTRIETFAPANGACPSGSRSIFRGERPFTPSRWRCWRR